jgi:protein phosphatase
MEIRSTHKNGHLFPEFRGEDIIPKFMLEAYGVTDPGCVRQNNEDFFHIDPDLGLYLLADGMGGAQAGEKASRIAVETVSDYVARASDRGVETLVQGFEEANRRVLAQAHADSHLNGMGTTLVGVLDCGNQLAIASVGDSRAYLFENDHLMTITEDQTWAYEVGRRLGLDSERLKSHPMRHVLTMAIGVETPLRVHSYSVRPAGGVRFLLCSDGLHGVVSAENITQGLRNMRDLRSSAHYLIEAARNAGGPDNITLILIRHAL